MVDIKWDDDERAHVSADRRLKWVRELLNSVEMSYVTSGDSMVIAHPTNEGTYVYDCIIRRVAFVPSASLEHDDGSRPSFEQRTFNRSKDEHAEMLKFFFGDDE